MYQRLRGLPLASPSYSTHSGQWLVIRGPTAGFFLTLQLQFSFTWAQCDDAGLSTSVALLSICSHTTGIGDTVVMGQFRVSRFFVEISYRCHRHLLPCQNCYRIIVSLYCRLRLYNSKCYVIIHVELLPFML